MSRLSEARISKLAHLTLQGLQQDDLVDISNESRALRETKNVLADFFGWEDRLDEAIRQKIQSLSRAVPPGSREWDVLYRKYFEEEIKRHKS